MKKLLDIENLTIAYSKIDNQGQNQFIKFLIDKKRSYTLLRNVNLSVFEGEYLGLVGESGCGKSLTMKSIFGMIDFDPGIVSGKIVLNDIKNDQQISILNTKNRKYFNKHLSSNYFSENHLLVINKKVCFPDDLMIDYKSPFFLYNKSGDYKELIMHDNCKKRIYNLSENENKLYTHCFILCKKVIPLDNKNNIKEILDSSQSNSVPGKFISIILQDPLSFMNPYWSMLKDFANQAGIDPYFALAIMREESHFDPRALSSSKAIGLMQLMPATAKEVAKRKNINLKEREEIFDPEINTKLGTSYLGTLAEKFQSELIYTAGGYNAGPHNMIKWINRWSGKSLDAFVEQIPFKETRNYVKRVYRSYKIYKQIYSS